MSEIITNEEIKQKKHDYDARAKRLLSRKEVIANILKHVVKEFKSFSIPEIIGCLNGEPEVAVEPVDDPDLPPNMDVAGSETVSENEGKRTFDIKFKVKVPDDDIEVELIINIESQYSYHPGYVLERRGVYYIARGISAQYNVEFTNSNFDNLKKVYSIWICTNAPQNVANTITAYSMKPEYIVGEVPDIPANYDLMTLVMINLGSTEKNYSGLIKMLDLLLNKIVSDRQKALETLENEFNIPLQSIKEEVDPMCNLSTGIYNNGVAAGIATGRAEGITIGEIINKIKTVKKLVTEKGYELKDALDFAEIDKETYEKYSNPTNA